MIGFFGSPPGQIILNMIANALYDWARGKLRKDDSQTIEKAIEVAIGGLSGKYGWVPEFHLGGLEHFFSLPEVGEEIEKFQKSGTPRLDRLADIFCQAFPMPTPELTTATARQFLDDLLAELANVIPHEIQAYYYQDLRWRIESVGEKIDKSDEERWEEHGLILKGMDDYYARLLSELPAAVVAELDRYIEEKARLLREEKRTIPEPPTPYTAHPYPLPKDWIGRQTEMDDLDAWLSDSHGPRMCCVVAIGGMGKSSLAWAWLQGHVVAQHESLGLSGVFQWSFYEGEVSFQRLLEDLSAYLGVPTDGDAVTAVTQRLREQRVLLVLDGFERLLRAYAAPDAALLPERAADELEAGERQCIEWPIARLLRSLVAGNASKALVVSRLVPEELDELAGWQLMELYGLDPADAVAYLRASGIKGTDRELEDAAAQYDFHPLSLSKLANVLHYDLDGPDDIRQAPRYDVTVDLKAREHHILELAYDTLPAELQQFLSALAALRGKPTIDAARFLASDWSDPDLSANLRRLEEYPWLVWERGEGTLSFHPVVRRYAYERLVDKPAVHARLAEYFRPLTQATDTEEVQSVGELAPVIELYHHVARAGRYDEALDLFFVWLNQPLYYRFGAYQTIIELLRGLFPDGEEQPPRLTKEGDQGWTLHELANSYSLSGQARRAVPLYKVAIRICEGGDYKQNLAVGLGAVASVAYLPLGELAAAEGNTRRRIALSREIEHAFGEAVGHQELGRLLSYQGAFEEAAWELDASTQYWERTGDKPGICLDEAYRALRALLMGDTSGAVEAAHRARELADIFHLGGKIERNIIRAGWLLGAALVALASEERDRQGEILSEAEAHLTEALTRCRCINMVDHEPDILLAWARWHRARGNIPQAREHAEEALAIAARCEYRLAQADIHNFLSQCELDAGNTAEARRHAEIAKERAWCDGTPHRYKPAFEEAERLLEEIAERS